MKITFELKGIEEEDKAQRILRGDEVFSLLWDIDQHIRGKLKYYPEFKTKDEEITYLTEQLEEVRTMIHENNILDLYQ
jgi:hypothetical protein